jgi:hypothetical protein
VCTLAADLKDKFFKRKKIGSRLVLGVVKSSVDVATLFVGKTPLPAIRSTTSIKRVGDFVAK